MCVWQVDFGDDPTGTSRRSPARLVGAICRTVLCSGRHRDYAGGCAEVRRCYQYTRFRPYAGEDKNNVTYARTMSLINYLFTLLTLPVIFTTRHVVVGADRGVCSIVMSINRSRCDCESAFLAAAPTGAKSIRNSAAALFHFNVRRRPISSLSV